MEKIELEIMVHTLAGFDTLHFPARYSATGAGPVGPEALKGESWAAVYQRRRAFDANGTPPPSAGSNADNIGHSRACRRFEDNDFVRRNLGSSARRLVGLTLTDVGDEFAHALRVPDAGRFVVRNEAAGRASEGTEGRGRRQGEHGGGRARKHAAGLGVR